MWCSRGCLGPPASTKACWWHVELDGGSRRRGCAAGGVSVKINRLLGALDAVTSVVSGVLRLEETATASRTWRGRAARARRVGVSVGGGGWGGAPGEGA